ncbi:hypothetical protein BB560_004516 [Smittium megazygosporum]|uniref:Uncharacterized protein n=1 Tax=Smittium megazygosporum TaxID=133381 RepID=A0A2T9Z908_9FUNG|nr:hypothetical protein BB560_004516 [Smittium megazygosporum]
MYFGKILFLLVSLSVLNASQLVSAKKESESSKGKGLKTQSKGARIVNLKYDVVYTTTTFAVRDDIRSDSKATKTVSGQKSGSRPKTGSLSIKPSSSNKKPKNLSTVSSAEQTRTKTTQSSAKPTQKSNPDDDEDEILKNKRNKSSGASFKVGDHQIFQKSGIFALAVLTTFLIAMN